MDKVFILVPAFTPHGPIKGAAALANSLVARADVTFVSIKHGPGVQTVLDDRVSVVCLADYSNRYLYKLGKYRSMLKKTEGFQRVISISMCFSADISNVFCARLATIVCSVRGNLILNYRYDYGALGIFLGMLHLTILRNFEIVVTMSNSMAGQVAKFTGKKAVVIGNFIDESAISSYRKKYHRGEVFKFVFVGPFTMRKQIGLILDAVSELKSRGVLVKLRLVGDGPLRNALEDHAKSLELDECVVFEGFIEKPFEIIAEADALVLPSLSEGISRAAMEALYLGVPCVLRDVDANSELIQDGVNGVLFSENSKLAAAMIRATELRRKLPDESFCLLSKNFRQDFVTGQYEKLIAKDTTT